MPAPSFGTAVAIFVNFWLVALTAFGVAATAIFLHILGAVNSEIGASVTISLVCAALSFVHLVLQSINATSGTKPRWNKLSLGRICIHLPRALIACWIVSTTIGLWRALSQPLCKSGDVKNDAAAWQNGLGCWCFRVLVSLNVVMLIMSFSVFILLEINGRRVPLGLFHFEYTSDTNSNARNRRRTLVHSAYGDSVVSLSSPMTITSEDEQHLTSAAEKQGSSASGDWPISPSPTYRTLEYSSTRSRAPTLPDPRLNPLEEESILNLSSSRQSTITTSTFSTVPLSQFPAAPSGPYTSGQLQSRPLSVSKLPALPTKVPGARPALHNVTNISAGNLKSSCALPLQSPTSTTLAASTKEEEEAEISPQTRASDEPAPAWCPNDLKTPLLSADPVIKRFTDMRRNSKLGLSRMSRRFSISGHGFEFGFGGVARNKVEDMHFEDIKPVADQKAEEAKAEAAKAFAETDKERDVIEEKENVEVPKIMDRNHRKRSTKRPSTAGKSLSTVPPPMPAPSAPRPLSTHPSQRRRGKSMVERGRYEKLPR